MVLATVRAGANSLGSVAHSLLVGAGLIGSSPGCDAPAKHSASTGKPRDVLSPLAEQHGEGTDARQSVPTCREPHYFEDQERGVRICYQLHGHRGAPEKVLFVMGVGSPKSTWQYQAEYFGNLPDYEVCTFDLRGIGASTAPLGRYTTVILAEDALRLLNHLGWTDPHSIHIVGSSMGGMISQKLALMIPERIISLSLLSTFSGQGGIVSKLPSAKGLVRMAMTVVAFLLQAPPSVRVELLCKYLFSQESMERNGTRCRTVIANALAEGVPVIGTLLHFPPAITHRLSEDHLEAIRSQPFKKLIVSGEHDLLVREHHAHALRDHLDADFYVIEGAAHGHQAERPDILNEVLHRHFVESKTLLHSR